MNIKACKASASAISALSCSLFGALVNPGHADVIQVYLQGGQSNADGRAAVSGLPTSPVNLQQAQADVAFFFHTQGSAHALDSTLTTLRPGMSETSAFGPEITFGRDMADYFSGTPNVSVAVIKYANGGTNLHTQWKAGGDATTTGDGSEYVVFQNTVTAGLAAITAANPGDTVTIAGMIWHQGESDSNSSANAAAYETNLTNFIADVRATYGANLPFVIGEIIDSDNNGANRDTIRAAQAAVAAADSFAGFVDVDAFGPSSLKDHQHFNATGQIMLGSGFATEMQGLLTPDTSKPDPDPMSFSAAPSAVDDSSITMTATTATDASGVEYFFENTDGGGHDSGWQDSPVYVDTGLLADTEYSYRVKARDKSAGRNETGFSDPEAATTISASTPTVLTSIADTYIRDSNATTNYGSDAFMVANDNGSSVRMTVFSFDISAVPPGTITAAKLELEDVVGNTSQNYEIWGLLDADETFDESTLTWDTAGFLDGTSIDLTKAYGGATLGTFGNTANSVNTLFAVDSGNFLDFLNASGDNDVTFVIVDPSSLNGGSGWATKEHGTALIPTLTLITGPVDSTPPDPNPMSFFVAPSAAGHTSVAMMATTAADAGGVEYFFENTDGGGNGSGWQDSPVYVDAGLLPDTEYSYRVKARDKSLLQNETDFSDPKAATTTSAPPMTMLTSLGDTYIRNSSADTNFGSDTSMVTNLSGSDVRMAVFSFDIAAVPPGTIAGAKLELEDVVGGANQPYEIWGLLDADETFDESTLTWNTAGFLSGSGVDVSKAYGGAALGTYNNVQDSINTLFDVTSGNFLDFLNASGDNDVTFVIVDTNSSNKGTGWATKEHGTALIPTLGLSTTAGGYGDWDASYPGLDLSDPNADYDLDGLDNIIESWFGTNPGLPNPGVSIASTDGTTSVFTHPQSLTPPDDVIGSYQWSPNLIDWYDSGDGPVGGPTAAIVANIIGSATAVTVTASEVIPRLFLRATAILSL